MKGQGKDRFQKNKKEAFQGDGNSPEAKMSVRSLDTQNQESLWLNNLQWARIKYKCDLELEHTHLEKQDMASYMRPALSI